MAISSLGKNNCLPWCLSMVLCFCLPGTAQSKSVAGLTTAFPSSSSSNLPHAYERWLNEDVRWIITPAERAGFLRLSKDEDRAHFVEQFWLRRDPTPGTPENEYKEEHYRRIAFSNIHFGWRTVPGWNTDRGRIYILYGPADSIRFASTSSLQIIEFWHYNSTTHYSEDLKFVDICGCGDYVLDPRQEQPTVP